MPLLDFSIEDFTIIGKLMDQVHELVQYYFTDRLQVTTVKHIQKNFWPQVLVAAFASILSEVLINNTHYAAQIKGE
jgi:alpha-amylase